MQQEAGMTFKDNWEKSDTQYNLADPVIRKMLKIAYPNKQVNHYEIIAGGCANINIKADLLGLESPIILRVYMRDPMVAYKEQKIGRLLSDKVPLPQIYHHFNINLLQFDKNSALEPAKNITSLSRSKFFGKS